MHFYIQVHISLKDSSDNTHSLWCYIERVARQAVTLGLQEDWVFVAERKKYSISFLSREGFEEEAIVARVYMELRKS